MNYIMFQETADHKLKCGKCLSVISNSTASKSAHLRTKKHRYTDECSICYEYSNSFWKCEKCKNSHCINCHLRLKSFICPFCRECLYSEIENQYWIRKENIIHHLRNSFHSYESFQQHIIDLRKAGGHIYELERGIDYPYDHYLFVYFNFKSNTLLPDESTYTLSFE